MSQSAPEMLRLAQVVADRWIALPGVRAVALGGSLARYTLARPDMVIDEPGDIDLYIYVDQMPDPSHRAAAIDDLGAKVREIDRQFWETEDSWFDAASGTLVEAMYRSTDWVTGEVAAVLDHHRPSIGYSTCIVDNVRDSLALADPNGWYADLQQQTDRPYPTGLRDAIVAKNHPILRTATGSYRYQIESALRRGDANSIAHRTPALLASFWDILFAINLAWHPGEKRLVAVAERRCPVRPSDVDGQIRRIVGLLGESSPELLVAVDGLLDDLDECAEQTISGMDERPFL